MCVGCGSLAFLVLAAVVADLRLIGHLERVDGAFERLTDRPPDTVGTTIMLLATNRDARTGPKVAWLADQPGLESLMLVDVPPGAARRISVSTVPISPALARSLGSTRASATVGGIEVTTGRRVDHLMALDWAAIEKLAADNACQLSFEQGSGIAAQHEYLQQVLACTLHTEMRRKPWTVYAALDTVSRGMAVDEEWSMLDMDLLVLSLRDLRSAAIEFHVD